ncbi:peptidoglycan-binding domain-containing protein [Micromonospora sp. BRA006-A]|nr:peptidoglycan-binding domain-containing protein [Micromonospora sp. BRA006-A]
MPADGSVYLEADLDRTHEGGGPGPRRADHEEPTHHGIRHLRRPAGARGRLRRRRGTGADLVRPESHGALGLATGNADGSGDRRGLHRRAGHGGALGDPSPSSTTDADVQDAMRRGDTGDRVQALQERLDRLGYWVGETDGTFGLLTEQAVYALQKAAGLRPDGIVGAKTRAALDDGKRPDARSTDGHLAEVDLDRQLLMIVDDGEVSRIFNTSTGTFERYTHQGRPTWRTPHAAGGPSTGRSTAGATACSAACTGRSTSRSRGSRSTDTPASRRIRRRTVACGDAAGDGLAVGAGRAAEEDPGLGCVLSAHPVNRREVPGRPGGTLKALSLDSVRFPGTRRITTRAG